MKKKVTTLVSSYCQLYTPIRPFLSFSFLLFLSIQGRRSSSGRSSILLYIPYVASTMGSKEARNSIARFLLSDIKLPPSLSLSLSPSFLQKLSLIVPLVMYPSCEKKNVLRNPLEGSAKGWCTWVDPPPPPPPPSPPSPPRSILARHGG